jgi:hypothetical protein
MTCVAMGYPDDSFPANAVKSDREEPRFRSHGFADYDLRSPAAWRSIALIIFGGCNFRRYSAGPMPASRRNSRRNDDASS